MGTLILDGRVILPLIPAAGARRWLAMTDIIKDMKLPPVVLAVILVVMGVGSLATPFLWLTGNISNNSITASNVASMQKQMEGLATQQDVARIVTDVAQMRAELRLAPRSADLLVLDRHLSAQDGRMDGIDTRLRDMENRAAAIQARVENLEAASKVPLVRR
jgi:hypothetical protein